MNTVTRYLSFTRDAEELRLTWHAVSNKVTQPNKLLQHLLFHRVHRRLQLPPAGDLYPVDIRETLTQLEMSTYTLRSYWCNKQQTNDSL